jgi:RNA polymerase sigma-70 factor (ECF subfamily)
MDLDAAAFDAVYEEYRPRIYAFLVRMTGQKALAEDLVQETFVRLAEKAVGLRPDTNVRAWLFTVARNLARSHFRWSAMSAGHLEELARLVAGGPTLGPEEAAAGGQAGRRLEQALLGLGAADRELLLLVGAEGLAPAEAAVILDISEEAARQRLSRARKRLAERLEATAAPAVPRRGGFAWKTT